MVNGSDRVQFWHQEAEVLFVFLFEFLFISEVLVSVPVSLSFADVVWYSLQNCDYFCLSILNQLNSNCVKRGYTKDENKLL